MDCRVVVEAAVPVYDVATEDEAVRIAISKTGEMLNPDLNYVEINMGERSCPHCGEAMEPAFVAADESLVALELEMTVFNVEREEHASRIARKEIGQRLENIPLEVLQVDVIEESGNEDESADADTEPADDTEADSAAENGDDQTPADPPTPDASSGTSGTDGAVGDGDASDDDLPDFEDIIREGDR